MEDSVKVVMDADSKPMTRIQELNLGRIRIVFLDSTGKPWTKECGEPIMSHRWILYINDKPQYFIKSVELPELRYDRKVAKPLTAKVEFYCIENETGVTND